jgi:hypothetical protein
MTMLVMTVVSIIASVAMMLLMKPSEQQPEQQQKEDRPDAKEGHIVGVAFGRVKLENSAVVWYGDVKLEPIYSTATGKK